MTTTKQIVEALRDTCTNDCGRALSSSLVAVCRNCLLADELADKAIVPREPSEMMVKAAFNKVNACTYEVYESEIVDIYRAMLAAAGEGKE